MAKLVVQHTAPAEPELFADNLDYLQAFYDLSPSRAVGFDDIGAIPISAVADYWDRAGVGDFLTFLRRVRAADNAFMGWNRELRRRRR